MIRSLRLLRTPCFSARQSNAFLSRLPSSQCRPLSTSAATAHQYYNEDVDNTDAELEARRKIQLLKEIDEKTGRGFSDPYDVEDMMMSKETYETLPEWTPKLVSRISQERVQIYSDKIPSLETLAQMNLPPSPPPHPAKESLAGQTKLYALHRKRQQSKIVAKLVEDAAAPEISRIKKLASWEDKQDAVDELFEEIEFKLKEKEIVLGKHPMFGTWVERGLEKYLQRVQQEPADDDDVEKEKEDEPVPIFIDCFSEDTDSEDKVEPKILHPLKPLVTGQNLGRMIEEWELAAHRKSKRIMLRDCTRKIAQALQESTPCRVLVDGTRGSGKTAALAAIVASARKSGHIVLYLPDGDQLSKNGFYLEPNLRHKGIYDLPVLSEHVCAQLLESHRDDLGSFSVDRAMIEECFSADQLKKLGSELDDGATLVKLLELGAEKTAVAPACYTAAVKVLMNQEEKDFIMVADEFNSYFQPGHYFHMDYDVDVKEHIPYGQISLFKPLIDAMAVSAVPEDSSEVAPPTLMKRGGIVAGMSRSRAVSESVSNGLSEYARQSADIMLCIVPRLSQVEIEHMLANYESIGVGKLRLDQGDVVMNSQEVAFLRTVSSGVPQRLLDACII